MRKKWIVVLCVTFGLLAGTFVFVEAKVFKKPVTIKKTLKVLKSVTIGTKNNLGKLFVKGEISNPLNGEKVVVNDDLSVKKNLDIYGNLRIFGNYEKVTVINTKDLADESVTTSKIAKKAVTTAKLDSKAVTTGKIDDEAITKDKIEDGTITGKKISSSANLDIKSIVWQAKSGVVNVAPADCVTEDNSAFTVSHLQFYPAARKDVYCGVHLPSGAIVTKLSVNGSDISTIESWNLVADLYRDNFSAAAHSVQTLASITVSTSSGRAIGTNSTINNAIVDNENYFYSLKLAFPTGDGTIVFNSARINYTFTQPY